MTNKEYETVMLDFLHIYLSMAAGETAGVPDNPHKLNPRSGLCYNIMLYTTSRFGGEEGTAMDRVLRNMLNGQIHRQLPWVAGALYPFNEDDYTHRVMHNTQHECPGRLAFVKQYIEYLEA